MNGNYAFFITNKMLNYIASIIEKVDRIESYIGFKKNVALLEENNISAVCSSFLIDSSFFSEEDIKKIIISKSKNNIEERKINNLYNLYRGIEKINPYSVDDMKKTVGILDENFKNNLAIEPTNEGFFDGRTYVVMSSESEKNEFLLNNLFNKINENKNEVHPLMLSSLIHYDILMLNNFSSDNTKLAMLWQSKILCNWKETFGYISLEMNIKKNINKYNQVIDECKNNRNANSFIEFILEMLEKSIGDLIIRLNNEKLHISTYVTKLLKVLDNNNPMSANEIMAKLKIKSKETFRANYLSPAMENGLVKPTIPDKPTSKNQKYYKV